MMKKIFAVAALLSACLLFIGCDQFTSIEQIDVESAKSIALTALDLSGTEVSYIEAELKSHNGRAYYDVDITVDGVEYDFDVDAVSGVIIARDTDDDGKPLPTATEATQTAESSVYPEFIGEVKAFEIAIAHSGLAADDVTRHEWKPKQKDGGFVYELTFQSNNTYVIYYYEIDAKSGEVLGFSQSSSAVPVPADTQAAADIRLTNAQALDIALTAVGATAEQVDVFKNELDRDDHSWEYEIAFLFIAKNTVYRYEIDAVSGAVKSYSHQPHTADSGNGSSQLVVLPDGNLIVGILDGEQAKAIALQQVNGANLSHLVEFEIDTEGGMIEYEGKIVYGGMEYEFEIDAYSGAIREWSSEPVNDC